MKRQKRPDRSLEAMECKQGQPTRYRRRLKTSKTIGKKAALTALCLSMAALLTIQMLAYLGSAHAAMATKMATANPVMTQGTIASGNYADTSVSDDARICLRESNGSKLDTKWESWQAFIETAESKITEIRVFVEANASSDDDHWYMRFYDYSTSRYALNWYQIGSGGFGPSDQTYTVSITDRAIIQKYIDNSGAFKINLCDGKASGPGPNDITRTDLNIDYFAVQFTYDVTAPVISNVNATYITDNSTVITWQTDEPSTSQVEYGLDTGYGNQTPEDSNLVTNHSVTLSGLSAGTTYYFRVKSKDVVGNQATSIDYTFKTVKWIYSTSATSLAPPSVNPALGFAFIAGNDTDVNAMYSSNGSQAWAPYNTGGTIQSRSPVPQIKIDGTDTYVIYSASSDGYLYALNAATGAILNANWPKQVTTASLQGGVCGQRNLNIPGIDTSNTDKWVLFIGTYDTSTTSANKIVALDAVTGNVLWTYQGGGSNPDMDVIAVSPSPDWSNNAVYFTSYANGGTAQPSLWAFNSADGTLRWSKNLGNISSSPSVGSSNLFVGTNQGEIYKFDRSGNQKWVFNITGAGSVYGFPWVIGNKVYFSTTGGRVYSLVDEGSAVSANSAWGSGTGYVSIPSPSAPLVVNGRNKMYVGASDGGIYELKLSDGSVLAKHHVGYTVGDPALDTVRDYLLFGATNGKIYSLPIF